MSRSASPLPLRALADGEGTPLVFLHGFMGRGDDFSTVSALAPRAAYGVDLPGHGDAAEHLGPWDFASVVSDLEATFEAGLEGRIDLVGYSMGGRIALAYALAHPERVRTLVLESASPGLENDDERAARRASDEEWAVRFEREPLRDVLESWYAQPVLASIKGASDFGAHLERKMRNRGSSLARSLREMGLGAQPDLWPALETLEVNTVVITGARDAKFCAVGARMLARSAGHIAHEVIDGAGHNVHAEDPRAYSRLIVRVTAPAVSWPEERAHV